MRRGQNVVGTEQGQGQEVAVWRSLSECDDDLRVPVEGEQDGLSGWDLARAEHLSFFL